MVGGEGTPRGMIGGECEGSAHVPRQLPWSVQGETSSQHLAAQPSWPEGGVTACGAVRIAPRESRPGACLSGRRGEAWSAAPAPLQRVRLEATVLWLLPLERSYRWAPGGPRGERANAQVTFQLWLCYWLCFCYPSLAPPYSPLPPSFQHRAYHICLYSTAVSSD